MRILVSDLKVGPPNSFFPLRYVKI